MTQQQNSNHDADHPKNHPSVFVDAPVELKALPSGSLEVIHYQAIQGNPKGFAMSVILAPDVLHQIAEAAQEMKNQGLTDPTPPHRH